METIIIRPSVDSEYSNKIKALESAFERLSLIDKTICNDRIVYVFGEKIENCSPSNN